MKMSIQKEEKQPHSANGRNTHKTPRHSIRRQLILLMAVSLAIFLFVQALCLKWFAEMTQKRAFQNSQNSLGMISSQIITMFEDMEQLIFNVTFSQYIQEYITTGNSERKYLELYPILSEMLNNMSASNKNIYDIMLFAAGKTPALSLQKSHSLSVYNQMVFPADANQLSEMTALPAVVYGSSIYFPFARYVYSTSVRSGFMERIGTCIALCDGKGIQQLVEGVRIVDNAQLFVVDRYDTIIASNQREQIGTEFDTARYSDVSVDKRTTMEDGQVYVIQHADAREWQVFSIIPVKSLLRDVQGVTYLCTVIMLIAAVFMLVIGASISRHINKSVANIVQFMKDVTGGEREKRFYLKDLDEITEIAESANLMLDQMEEINKTMLKVQADLYEAKLLERQAQFMALQRQINPHFLFNTLNCIASIAAVHGISEIVQIASSMGQIFRYCIKGTDIVPLHEEIEIVKRYLEIVELRYRGKIRGTVDMEEDLSDMRMPKMILQPLVENAVFHGLEPKLEGGSISVRVYRCPEDMIAFDVSDDGIGMDPQIVQQMENSLRSGVGEDAENKMNSRIGLLNIVARVRFLLGEKAHLALKSDAGKGTCVTLYIPARHSGGKARSDA